MVKNGLITQRKTDEGVRYANNDFDWDHIGGGADNQGSPKPIRKTRVSKMNAATSVADLTVDISKTTGRIRLPLTASQLTLALSPERTTMILKLNEKEVRIVVAALIELDLRWRRGTADDAERFIDQSKELL